MVKQEEFEHITFFWLWSMIEISKEWFHLNNTLFD